MCGLPGLPQPDPAHEDNRQEAADLGLGTVPGFERRVKRYVNGSGLTRQPRDLLALDFYGLTVDELRSRFPAAYQWLVERVKPQRDQERRESRRKNWWLYGESVPKFRRAVEGLSRYIGTTEADEPATPDGTPDAAPAPAPAVPRRPWPTGLPEQIKAVAEVLAASPRALSLADLEQRFAARGRWRDRLPTIVDTLEALGRARRIDPAGTTGARWQSA